MEIAKAKEILEFAALADRGFKVDFLKKPEHAEVFVFVEPKSDDSFELCLKLQTVLYHDGIPLGSIFRRFSNPASALNWLSSYPLDGTEDFGTVSSHFSDFLERAFDACESSLFEAAFSRTKLDFD